MFVDWRGDPDELMTGQAGSEISTLLCSAAERGAGVFGLVWRSHLDKFRFSAAENRHLGEEIEDAGGCWLVQNRGRTSPSLLRNLTAGRRRAPRGPEIVFAAARPHPR